jgi:zinc protease
VAAVVFPFAFGGAVFVSWATARPGVSADDIERALVEEVDQLGDGGLTDQELDRARVLHRTSRAESLEEATERAERLGMYTALWDQPERINREVPSYDAIDTRAVRDAMRRFGGADNRLVLTFLPNGDA